LPPTTVINERLASHLWPGANPIGQVLYMGSEALEVIGVAADGKYEAYMEEPRFFLYQPMEQHYSGSGVLLARSRTEAAAVLPGIRSALASLDPNVAVEQSMPLATLIGFSIFPQRLAASMIGVFGVVGLLLAAIGLYGILAFQVETRRREIGIRMALGAYGRDVVRLVLRSSARLVAIGIVLGLAVSLGATRLLAGLLYGVAPVDPATFAAVPLLLAAVALMASYLPVRRATRVDPMVAIRAE
jgi:ABC-type antimicrobial peptide transport system permease subunit